MKKQSCRDCHTKAFELFWGVAFVYLGALIGWPLLQPLINDAPAAIVLNRNIPHWITGFLLVLSGGALILSHAHHTATWRARAIMGGLCMSVFLSVILLLEKTPGIFTYLCPLVAVGFALCHFCLKRTSWEEKQKKEAAKAALLESLQATQGQAASGAV